MICGFLAFDARRADHTSVDFEFVSQEDLVLIRLAFLMRVQTDVPHLHLADARCPSMPCVVGCLQLSGGF